jgi:simple sugar transport system permease protein
MSTAVQGRAHKRRFRIVKLQSTNRWVDFLAIIVALIAGLLVSAAIVAASGTDIKEAFGALLEGAFGSSKAFQMTLVRSTPLLFTGLSTVVAFRGKIWNIGGEGQFIAGAMMTAWISTQFADLPQAALVPMIILGAMFGGAAWAGIAGYLRAKFRVNEIIVTVMFNYIIQFILSYLLQGPWMDKTSYYIQTIAFGKNSYFPNLFGSKLHIGLVLALISALIVYLLLWKTPLGYEIRAIGVNPVSAKYSGINPTRIIILTMLISGALAGLGGGTEIAAIHHRLRLDVAAGYGFAGILVAMVGQLHPFGAIISALFFGALTNGSYLMQINSKVPVALVHTMEGVILFFLVIAFVVKGYQIRRTLLDE